ncbi:MAG TPA: hypothetical protein VGH52_02615 [Gaiellaceae bacterium]|jgi:hypothetical protein
MNINHKQKVAGVAAAVVMLVGGGSALAATRGGHGPGGPGDPLAAAASYLGISESTLQSDLRSGKTLAQVANDTSGKSSSGLIAALVAKEESDIESRVTALVNSTFPPPGQGHSPPPGTRTGTGPP